MDETVGGFSYLSFLFLHHNISPASEGYCIFQLSILYNRSTRTLIVCENENLVNTFKYAGFLRARYSNKTFTGLLPCKMKTSKDWLEGSK